MHHILPIIMLLTLPLAAEILKNTSFEDVKDDTFVSWSRNNFRTGGSLYIGTFGGHTGDKFAICHSNSDQEREAWAQRQPLPQNCVAVLVSAWYRCTPEVKAANNTGPCLRVHWFDASKKEILLEQKFFPVVDDWKLALSLLGRMSGGIYIPRREISYSDSLFGCYAFPARFFPSAPKGENP